MAYGIGGGDQAYCEERVFARQTQVVTVPDPASHPSSCSITSHWRSSPRPSCSPWALVWPTGGKRSSHADVTPQRGAELLTKGVPKLQDRKGRSAEAKQHGTIECDARPASCSGLDRYRAIVSSYPDSLLLVYMLAPRLLHSHSSSVGLEISLGQIRHRVAEITVRPR